MGSKSYHGDRSARSHQQNKQKATTVYPTGTANKHSRWTLDPHLCLLLTSRCKGTSGCSVCCSIGCRSNCKMKVFLGVTDYYSTEENFSFIVMFANSQHTYFSKFKFLRNSEALSIYSKMARTNARFFLMQDFKMFFPFCHCVMSVHKRNSVLYHTKTISQVLRYHQLSTYRH